MKKFISAILALVLFIGVTPVHAAELYEMVTEEAVIAQEIKQETQRVFADIHTQLEEQNALKYELELQEIAAKQIELNVYRAHGYTSPASTYSANAVWTETNVPNGGVVGYTQVGLTQVLCTYLSRTATNNLLEETGNRIQLATSIDKFTETAGLFASAAATLFHLSLEVAAAELAIRAIANAYIVMNTLPNNVANGKSCAYIMTMYIPVDNVTVNSVLEWSSYPNISTNADGNYNYTFEPF